MNKLFKFQNCAFSYSSTKAPIITNMKKYTVIEYIFMTTKINFDCNSLMKFTFGPYWPLSTAVTGPETISVSFYWHQNHYFMFLVSPQSTHHTATW
jgi:hypothetical protein